TGFPAAVTDNTAASVGDIVASWATVSYAGPAIALRYPNTAGPGVAFDNVLTNSVTVTPQIPNFIRNIQLNNGSTAVTSPAAANNATSITVAAQDAAGNFGTNTPTFAPGTQLVAGSTADIRQNTTAN